MTAYYNENNLAAAAILEVQIRTGVIAPGVVDTRSIKDVQPDDLIGFTQCHFFAGGGLWSVAARIAGWPDHEPIWTASCPCQPFSAAGKGAGIDDPRHLWPDLYRLKRARRPVVTMGEQVAGAAGYGWFDGVRADLAREGFAARTIDFPACSVDAPQQRNRQYWAAVDMVNAPSDGWGEGWAEHELRSGWPTTASADAPGGGILADDGRQCGRAGPGEPKDGPISTNLHGQGRNGTYWSDAEWIECHDGKARRAKPGLRLLAHGVHGRMDLWRVGGNAIVPEAAAEVIGAFIDVYGLPSTWRTAA